MSLYRFPVDVERLIWHSYFKRHVVPLLALDFEFKNPSARHKALVKRLLIALRDPVHPSDTDDTVRTLRSFLSVLVSTSTFGVFLEDVLVSSVLTENSANGLSSVVKILENPGHHTEHLEFATKVETYLMCVKGLSSYHIRSNPG